MKESAPDWDIYGINTMGSDQHFGTEPIKTKVRHKVEPSQLITLRPQLRDSLY